MNNTSDNVEEVLSIPPVIEEVKPEDKKNIPKNKNQVHAFELKDLSYKELLDCYNEIHAFIKYLKGLKE